MARAALQTPTCEEVAERLSDLLDGELGEVEAAAMRLHLAACAGCARFAAELEATILALHRLPHGPRGAGRRPAPS